MDVRGKKVMVLGGYGEVGFAICRELLHQHPKALVVTSLRKEEALTAVGELRKEASNSVQLTPIHGNLFVRWSMKDASREEILSNPRYQSWLVEDALPARLFLFRHCQVERRKNHGGR